MNSIERFLKTVERKPVDYPASWLGMPDVETLPILFDYFKVDDMAGLKAPGGNSLPVPGCKCDLCGV